MVKILCIGWMINWKNRSVANTKTLYSYNYLQKVMPSAQKDIVVLLMSATILVMIGSAIYASSPNLVPTELNPPAEINYNSDSSFYFKLHNYGEKAGSYNLQISSDALSVKVRNSEYRNSADITKHMEDGDDSTHRFYLKANKSNLPINVTFKLIYLDTSPIAFDKKYVWDYYYELDDSLKYEKYVFGNVQSSKDYCILIFNKYGYCTESHNITRLLLD
ncbi:MAG: hypothetical protein KAH86_02985 [Methanosarcinales archaeon]|nr:hypothetical protein [Methanosarcinales archaeon]